MSPFEVQSFIVGPVSQAKAKAKAKTAESSNPVYLTDEKLELYYSPVLISGNRGTTEFRHNGREL